MDAGLHSEIVFRRLTLTIGEILWANASMRREWSAPPSVTIPSFFPASSAIGCWPTPPLIFGVITYDYSQVFRYFS